jgi:hypothetical protein
MNIGYDPRVFSIILTRDARVLDRCMNEGSASGLGRKRQMYEQFLCDPRVLSITLTQNPKILDRCLNGRLIIGSYECLVNNKAIKMRPFDLILKFT